ncbi:hypothetical protein B5P45_19115 [Phyllobacterium zundukense]|uniref:Uncharacterized protein n=1 Tax=Phyllobacterium zundukense TaxID=1867719 RepID=A0A2N9VUN1_9HYPH|nr:hypothetical protein BLM14_26965 [Phyllobacterium zundukense]PIO43199.1 hypothetical protein B5P45_19115 [Phyllobacterium zundukense]
MLRPDAKSDKRFRRPILFRSCVEFGRARPLSLQIVRNPNNYSSGSSLFILMIRFGRYLILQHLNFIGSGINEMGPYLCKVVCGIAVCLVDILFIHQLKNFVKITLPFLNDCAQTFGVIET